MVSLAYRKRAIPIAWTWVKHVKGHSTAEKHLPKGVEVFLMDDTEFGPVNGLKQVARWGCYYVFRHKTRTHVCENEQQGWKVIGCFVHKPEKVAGWESGIWPKGKSWYPTHWLGNVQRIEARFGREINLYAPCGRPALASRAKWS